jgi:hypothetical protein
MLSEREREVLTGKRNKMINDRIEPCPEAPTAKWVRECGSGKLPPQMYLN